MSSTASSTAPAPQQRQLSREELRRHGLPADWNDRLRSGDGKAEHRGQIYGRRPR
jgi:hypothetical protein